MSERVIRGVPTGETKSFCRLQKALGATKCEITDRDDGKSDIVVAFPGEETFAELKARRNK